MDLKTRTSLPKDVVGGTNEKVLIKHGNPTPLGLIGLSMALIMLSLHYVTLIKLDTAVVATVFTLGFLLQLIAGITEYKKGNTFRSTAFTVLSMYFLSLILMWTGCLGTYTILNDATSVGIFFAIWTVIPVFILCCVWKTHMMLKMILIDFILYNLFLAIGYFAATNALVIVGGVFGLICAAMILIYFIMHSCNKMNIRDAE